MKKIEYVNPLSKKEWDLIRWVIEVDPIWSSPLDKRLNAYGERDSSIDEVLIEGDRLYEEAQEFYAELEQVYGPPFKREISDEFREKVNQARRDIYICIDGYSARGRSVDERRFSLMRKLILQEYYPGEEGYQAVKKHWEESGGKVNARPHRPIPPKDESSRESDSAQSSSSPASIVSKRRRADDLYDGGAARFKGIVEELDREYRLVEPSEEVELSERFKLLELD